MRTIVLAVSAVLLLTGCGGGAEAARQPAPATVTSAPTGALGGSSPGPWRSGYVLPAPTPTVLTRAEAARRYLAIVGPSNRAGADLQALTRGHEQDPPTARVPADYRRRAAVASTTLRAFIRDLLETRWPADVAPTASQLVDQSAPLVTTYEACAQAQTWADVSAAWAADTSSNAPAQRIRIQLGLGAAK